MRTEMNMLALGDFILFKEDQPEWPEGKGVGLESVKKEMDTESMYPADFLKKLKQFYHSEFLETSRTMRNSNLSAIESSLTGAASVWLDVQEPEDLKAAFDFAAAVSDKDSSYDEFLNGVISAWLYKEAAEASLPMLKELFKMAKAYPLRYDIEEEVPESVYAMF
jgi:hypothetical protein